MFLQVDVLEVDGELILEAELPGVRPDALEIRVARDRVTIRGSRSTSTGARDAPQSMRMRRRERHRGEFQREIPLPCPVLRDEAAASLLDGILTLRLPLAPKDASRCRVEVSRTISSRRHESATIPPRPAGRAARRPRVLTRGDPRAIWE